MRWLVVIGVLVAMGSPARADNELANWLVGPVVGIRLSGPPNDRTIIGLEGGVGAGPERLNLGFEHRSDHDFGYLEIDPWYILGGTFGVGMDDAGKASAVLGVWEGIPIADNNASCTGWHSEITLAGGYRYTGVHELYITLKAGRMNGNVCFD